MKLTRLIPLAAALAATVAAGCSPMPSTAAQVGDARISEAQLTRVAEGCASVGLGTEQVSRSTLLMSEVLGLIAEKLAEDNGQSVSDEEAQALLRESNGSSPALGDPECARVAASSAKLQLLVTKLGENADIESLQQQFEAVDVQLNPRYGTWDPAGAGITGTGSLSVPS